MKVSPSCSAIAFLLAWSLLLPPGLSCQDFSSLDKDLLQLESLIHDTLENSEAQRQQLEDLQKNLAESGELLKSYEGIIAGQESLLRDLQGRLSAMSETYRKQSELSARYEQSSKFWKRFTLAAVPVAALLGGVLVWAIK
jgi:hypothetical protein